MAKKEKSNIEFSAANNSEMATICDRLIPITNRKKLGKRLFSFNKMEAK